MKEKILVAMSGGVDSSLTAALLLEAGYEVEGVTMYLFNTEDGKMPQAVADARMMADFLGIRHHVADFRERFQSHVVDYFLSSYAKGETPNPCVICNRFVKFGGLLAFAQQLGFDKMATGHYARVEKLADGYAILKGIDKRKDQSYALHRLPREFLSHIVMPLGVHEKTETRALARARNLPVANKPESQEICFVPNDDYKAYIRTHRPEALRPGDIVDTEGHVLGHHQGVAFYTIGQRKGLGIAASHPLYVHALDPAKAQVIVGENRETLATGLVANDANWHKDMPSTFTANAKIRYGNREAKAEVMQQDDGTLHVHFETPQRAVTPGQYIVFYEGERLLGGARILHAN